MEHWESGLQDFVKSSLEGNENFGGMRRLLGAEIQSLVNEYSEKRQKEFPVQLWISQQAILIHLRRKRRKIGDSWKDQKS